MDEFIFYSDDEDEKVFFDDETVYFNRKTKKSPSTIKLSPSRLHQTNSNHQSNKTSPDINQFDWSATTYSSLFSYSNYFDNPPIDTNYFAPKLLEKNYFNTQPLSTITSSVNDNQTKRNLWIEPTQSDPIHKQISNLINDSRPILNLNSKKSTTSNPYQTLISDQHQRQNPDHSPSMKYSSESFPVPSRTDETSRNNAQNSDPNHFHNLFNAPPQQNSPVNKPILAVKPQPAPKLTKTASWSQIAASKPAPTPPLLPNPLPPRSTTPKLTPSPPPVDPTPLPPPEYHRGPKVDPRWPIEQQLFLGPIPVVVTWDELRLAFYNKINRQHVVHTYVQSKPVNEVVYGMIVFDKSTTANKILKEGPITVKGYLISISPMCQRLQARKK